MTDAINPNLNLYTLTDHISEQPQGTRIGRHRAPGIALPATTTLIEAARLTARAELEELGFNETRSGNPIDAILMAGPTPLFNQLTTAIALASRAEAFDAPLPPPPAHFNIGDMVRILRDPTEEIPDTLINATARITYRYQDNGSYDVTFPNNDRYTVDHDNLEPVR